MNVQKMMKELRGELEHIQQALTALEHLARSGSPRRGRPPLWLSAATKVSAKSKKVKEGKPREPTREPVAAEDSRE